MEYDFVRHCAVRVDEEAAEQPVNGFGQVADFCDSSCLMVPGATHQFQPVQRALAG